MRIFDLDETDLDEENPWGEYLAATAFAIRSIVHTTLGASPTQLVYERDMILSLQHKADWATITLKKQKRIDELNRRENLKWSSIEYKEGNLVLLNKSGILSKLAQPRAGPYLIEKVHDNCDCHHCKEHGCHRK